MGQVSSVPLMFGTSYMRSHSMRNDNQILRGDQTRCEENVYKVDHKCWHVIYLQYLTFLYVYVASMLQIDIRYFTACVLDCKLHYFMQEMVSLNIDGHQVQLLPSTQQTVLSIDPSQSDFIHLPYVSSEQFQQQLSSLPMVSY